MATRVYVPSPYARRDDRYARQDVPEGGAAALVFREHPETWTLEKLTTRADRPRLAFSRQWTCQVKFRGFYPLAGTPRDLGLPTWTLGRAEAKDGKELQPAPALIQGSVEDARDGEGCEATFAGPCGIAMVGMDDYDGALWPGLERAGAKLVVADPGSHSIRCVVDNRVVTRFGTCGKPGFQDDYEGRNARFKRPTFVAALPRNDQGNLTPEFVVTDTGNNAIRIIKESGEVRTLGGSGEPGFKDTVPVGDDHDPREAQFDDPQGVAVDQELRVLVADRNNRAIRLIELGGQVRTLARSEPNGLLDGLRGLALTEDGRLLAASGNRVVQINVESGAVELLIGTPDNRAGFLDCPPVPAEDKAVAPGVRALGSACLDQPWGLKVHGGVLHIADRGNHAVREYTLATRELRTLLGGPEKGGMLKPDQKPDRNRWGLWRDGINHPDHRHGVPFAPCDTVVFPGPGAGEDMDRMTLTCGSMLGEASSGGPSVWERRDDPCRYELRPPGEDGEAILKVTVPEYPPTWPTGIFLRVEHQPVLAHGELEGKRPKPRAGAWTALPQRVVFPTEEATFSLPCTALSPTLVRITAVTHAGWSFQTERLVQVAPRQEVKEPPPVAAMPDPEDNEG